MNSYEGEGSGCSHALFINIAAVASHVTDKCDSFEVVVVVVVANCSVSFH